MLMPFSECWRKFWPDCPFEAVCVTETLPGDSSERFCFDRLIRTYVGSSWSARVLEALRQIETPYVLLLCNDYFLCGTVRTGRLLLRLDQAIRYKALNLRLLEMPETDLWYATVDDGLPLKEYRKNSAYCISTQTGFWDVAVLSRLVSRTGSGWEFERKGSYLVGDERGPILCTPEREFPFLDAVHKGYWERRSVELCGQVGVFVDFAKRGFVPRRMIWKEWVRAKIIRCLPRKLLQKIRNSLT